jgi:hypothetical protein
VESIARGGGPPFDRQFASIGRLDPYGFELVDVFDDPAVSTYYFARRT